MSFGPSPSSNPSGGADGRLSPEPGFTGGFFLLKGVFFFATVAKCMLVGGHLIVGDFALLLFIYKVP